MSYTLSDVLQVAVYGHLSGDAELGILTDNAIFDALPVGGVPQLYVTLGPETVTDKSDYEIRAALHEFAITVVTETPGFTTAKTVAARIAELLDGADLNLSAGHLVRLDFHKAKARPAGAKREVELWFRAFVEDTPPA